MTFVSISDLVFFAVVATVGLAIGSGIAMLFTDSMIPPLWSGSLMAIGIWAFVGLVAFFRVPQW